MNKKMILILIPFIISCSNITVISKYNVDRIKEEAIKKIYIKNRDFITKDRIRISKRGFGKWFILAYGEFNNYEIEFDEDAKILKYNIIKFE